MANHNHQMVIIEEQIWEHGWTMDGKQVLVKYIEPEDILAINHEEIEATTLEIHLAVHALDIAESLNYN